MKKTRWEEISTIESFEKSREQMVKEKDYSEAWAEIMKLLGKM